MQYVVLYHIPRINRYFLVKPTRRTNIQNFILPKKNSTYFGHFLCPSSGLFYCTFDIGTFLAFWWELPSRVRMELQFHRDPDWKLSSKCKKCTNVECTIEIPDYGQRKYPKYIEFFDKIKFGKFVGLLGFIKKKFVTMHGHMNVKLNCNFRYSLTVRNSKIGLRHKITCRRPCHWISSNY